MLNINLYFIGGRTADEIVNWLNKKTGPAAKTLETTEELKTFTEEPQVAVVGFFKVLAAECLEFF
jgi:protein disulfide-isomerase A1